MDRVSSAGYALGYLGGGVLLALNLAWILKPAMVRPGRRGRRLAPLVSQRRDLVARVLRFRSSGKVPEPDVRHNAICRGREPGRWRRSASSAATLRELRQYRQAFLMLVAFLIYNDGIGTIIRMAGPYGQEIGLPQDALIAAFVMVQFVGIPFAFAFGRLADRIGAKPSIFIALVVYVLISLVGYFMTTIWQFFLLSFMVATVQGGSQALSRSLFATMIPQAQVVGVLRLLRRLREVRRDHGAAAVCGDRARDRLEPQRDPLGHRLLRRRRRAAVDGGRRRRQAGRC